MAEKKQFFCTKCKQLLDEKQFYKTNRLDKYPQGRLNTCRKCLVMHVDNWDPRTFLPILEEIDVPYVPNEWNKLLQKYGDDPEKVNGATILGRYLSIMKFKQWKDYRYKDSDFLQKVARNKVEVSMRDQGYNETEIAQALGELPVNPPPRPEDPEPIAPAQDQFITSFNTAAIGLAPKVDPQLEGQVRIELSDKEKLELRLKWGANYTPEEWVSLEKLFNEMMASYDIQTAGHIDTLKLICKTSLKANQLIDIGDIESYQKMSKVYDQLMKSGHFTANQNKNEANGGMNSIGEFIAMCEEQGYIERYYVDDPKDKVDQVLRDLEEYTHSLIYNEMNLGKMIEDAVTSMARQENQTEDRDEDEEDLTLDSLEAMKAEDYLEKQEFEEEERMSDEEFLEMLKRDNYL